MVNDWLKRFFNEGLDGLKEKPRTGRPKKLTPEQCSGQLKPHTFVKEFSYSIGDKSPRLVCNLSRL